MVRKARMKKDMDHQNEMESRFRRREADTKAVLECRRGMDDSLAIVSFVPLKAFWECYVLSPRAVYIESMRTLSDEDVVREVVQLLVEVGDIIEQGDYDASVWEAHAVLMKRLELAAHDQG